MNHSGSQAAVLALCALALAVGVVGVGGAVDAPAQQATPENNTTVQHERPDSVSQEGNTDRVKQWLTGRMVERLQGSTLNLSQGQYEQADQLLGEGYEDRLDQYVDVAGDTEDGDDDATGETLDETRRNQREFTNATQSYRETYEAYERAQQAGDMRAAREAARDLERIAARIEARNDSLTENYRTLENRTGIDTSDSRNRISTVARDIQRQQTTVREATLVETRLRVEAAEGDIAFDDPLSLTGRLTTENGTALADRPVRIRVAGRTYRPTTDADGRFNLSYRPVTLPANATSVSVAYVPANDSAYVGTSADVPVTVRQVTPTLSASAAPERAGFGDAVETTVTVSVDGDPVPGVPMRATLGESATQVRTNEAGQVVLTPRVPATVPDGERSVAVSQPRAGLAIGPASTTARVTIDETPTNLTLDASAGDAGVTVQGRLTTADGTPVPNQPVTVTAGSVTQSVETNGAGRYTATVDSGTSSSGANNSTLPVTASFDGEGTNLGASEARTTVTAPAGSGASGSGATGGVGGLADSTVAVLAGAGIVAIVLVVLGVRRWRAETADEGPTPPAGSDESTDGTDEPDPKSPSERWLAEAQSSLAADAFGPATVAAYAAVRARLQREAEVPETLTHREFVVAAESALEADDHAALRTLADAYEAAAFGGSVDADAASGAVSAAAALQPGARSA